MRHICLRGQPSSLLTDPYAFGASQIVGVYSLEDKIPANSGNRCAPLMGAPRPFNGFAPGSMRSARQGPRTDASSCAAPFSGFSPWD
jgi:hypothetical protein